MFTFVGMGWSCNEELEVLNGGTNPFAFCGNSSTKHEDDDYNVLRHGPP